MNEPLPSAAGVYCLTHHVTREQYIGCSISIRARVKGHLQALKLGKHINQSLADLVKRLGCHFDVSVLELVDEAELYDAEKRHIARLRPALNRCGPGVTPKPFLASPDDIVRAVFIISRPDRARLKMYCEVRGLKMEDVGAGWILERLATEERADPAPRRKAK